MLSPDSGITSRYRIGNMYIKLCCFKIESDIPRYVNAVFDGEEVLPKSEVLSKDESAPTEFVIQIDKIPGVYKMVLDCPDSSSEDDGTISVARIFVSTDNINWKDYRANLFNSNGTKLIDESVIPKLQVRSPKQVWNFWYNEIVVLNIEIPEDFDTRFPYATVQDILDFMQSRIELFPEGSIRRKIIENEISKSRTNLSLLL